MRVIHYIEAAGEGQTLKEVEKSSRYGGHGAKNLRTTLVVAIQSAPPVFQVTMACVHALMQINGASIYNLHLLAPFSGATSVQKPQTV